MLISEHVFGKHLQRQKGLSLRHSKAHKDAGERSEKCKLPNTGPLSCTRVSIFTSNLFFSGPGAESPFELEDPFFLLRTLSPLTQMCWESGWRRKISYFTPDLRICDF